MLLSRSCATIREIRDFNREIYGANRESVCINSLPLGPANPENPVVYFDISVGTKGDVVGRVEIELKQDVAPKTAENFLQYACSDRAGFLKI
eukprot:SAG31_NODE_2784_length_5092_cov_10.113158_4_plen_92_part_00